jgi:hypothetical protein
MTPGEMLAKKLRGDKSIANADIGKATKEYFESRGISCTVETVPDSQECRSHELQQALKRPKNYHKLPSSEQWTIDKNLGILDWEPTATDQAQYQKIMKEKSNDET